MYYIFNSQGELIATSSLEPNLEDLASRGEQAVQSEELFANPVLVEGEIVERGIAPSAYHQWNGTAWVLTEQAKTQQRQATRTSLLCKIADKTDRLKAEILAGYPQTEIDSFYRQEKEALALQADPNASAPMLREIAENRGVPLDILAQKVLEKAEQVAVVIGGIIGKRQGFEDRIQAVENAEEFAKLAEEIDQWQH